MKTENENKEGGEMESTTLYYSKFFTAGALRGLTFHDQISFPNPEAASKWLRGVERREVKGFGGARYRIVDRSFQKYAR